VILVLLFQIFIFPFGQVDLVLRLSDGTSEKIRDSQTCWYDGQIYFHWYKILGLLSKRALFDLQYNCVVKLDWGEGKGSWSYVVLFCIYLCIQCLTPLMLKVQNHTHKILGLLSKRALFDLQFVHNLFWLKLKWNARSKLFYWMYILYHLSFLHALKFKNIFQRFQYFPKA
jgi:hypothetical protein